jgi:hypothetical protein
MNSGFDWVNTETVFGSARAVAVYLDASCNVVIRQEAGALDGSDSVVVIPHDRVNEVIDALEILRQKVSP